MIQWRKLRPRYSLRTMFVCVTMVCLWLGYHLNWIRQRHEALASEMVLAIPAIEDSTRPPGMLSLLGENGHATIACEIKENGEEKQIEALFPEARIIVFAASLDCSFTNDPLSTN